MKITIVGAGNMGGAMACGMLKSEAVKSQDLTVIDHRGTNVDRLKAIEPSMNIVVNTYDSLSDADLVIIAVKPWMVQSVLTAYRNTFLKSKPDQIIASVAGGITLAQLGEWTDNNKPLCRIMPNMAIALMQSMTFISVDKTSKEQENQLLELFARMGKVEVIEEKLFSAAASLTSCGIAFAMRYIRAAMEGGVEMGFYPDKSKDFVLQTIRGAVEILETGGAHPEQEIDKVTTAGGTTIKGLNEMEHAGFSSAVIKGLKASNS